MYISPTEKLRRVLKLELSRNCSNRAMVGGMVKFLPNWQREATSAGIDAELVEKVSAFLLSYEGKDAEARKTAVEEILKSLPDEKNQAQHTGPDPRRKNQEHEKSRRNIPANDKKESVKRVSENSGEPLKHPVPPEKAAPAAASNPHFPVPQPNTPAEAGTNDESEKRSIQTPYTRPQRFPAEQPAPVPSRPMTPSEIREKFGHPFIQQGRSLESPVSVIPGIGTSNAGALAMQNVHTVRDFLYYFPRRYDDYSRFKTINRLVPDEMVSVLGVVKAIENNTRGKYLITDCLISDGTGTLKATWFNQQWLIRQIRVGEPIVLSGKIDVFLGRPVMNNPDHEPGDSENLITGRIIPIYALNRNLKQNFLRRMILNTVRHWKGQLEEFLPDSVLESADLIPLQVAIAQIHFPENMEMLGYAKTRLAFDEVFLTQLSVLSQKKKWSGAECEPIMIDEETLNGWIEHLPFTLTNAQLEAVRDIQRDMASGHPMNRLVQGDVGSGKTVVASIAALIASQGTGQTAIMAPTGVLTEQHCRNFLKFMESIGEEQLHFRPEQVEILTGGTTEAKKREIRERLASGEIKVIIGTHALIEDDVVFKDLKLAVIDEQHRFGVAQRAALRAKGTEPHILVMTATPIPRSLSLTIYGDLDLSVIGELPAGRQPIDTYVASPVYRERVYGRIAKEIQAGHQAFIIYPLVEEGEDEEKEGRAAIEASERLQNEIFPDFRVALLHGRMKADEKEAILTAFKDHEYDILVSTSVIEVGVDIPNATVMVIEGANRFGLAQLHQFRGRVGRGDSKSTCFLIPEKTGAEENQRLQAMVSTNDGFKLAEMDLEMRGPGDFIGKRQSGMRDLKLASLGNVKLIEQARKEAEQIFASDPDLSAEEHALLKKIVINSIENQEKGEIS